MTVCLYMYKFEYTVAHLCQSLLVVWQALGAFSASSYLVFIIHIFISWFVVAHFRNSLFEAGHSKKLSRKPFFGIYSTSMNQFLASYSSSISRHVYSAKKWSKTLIPAWNKDSNILHQVLKQMNALWQLFPPKFGHFFNKTILTMGINSLTDTKVKHCC